jgi:hypothetical protein
VRGVLLGLVTVGVDELGCMCTVLLCFYVLFGGQASVRPGLVGMLYHKTVSLLTVVFLHSLTVLIVVRFRALLAITYVVLAYVDHCNIYAFFDTFSSCNFIEELEI